MKKTLVLLVLMVLTFLVTTVGCAMGTGDRSDNRVSVIGSGNLVSRDFEISGFDSVSLGFAFGVSIRQGSTHSVKISIDEVLIDYLHVEKSDGILTIGLVPAYAYDIRDTTMRGEIQMPDIAGIEVSGSGGVILEDFQTDGTVDIELPGSSGAFGVLEAQSLVVRSSGSAGAVLEGTTKKLLVETSGSSWVDLHDLTAGVAHIESNGASSALVTVEGRIDALATGNSCIRYFGNPTLGEITSHEGSRIEPAATNGGN